MEEYETLELTREELAQQLAEAQTRVEQLEEALESRILIEQAKGVLAERLAIPIGEAFDLLRYAARSHRTKLKEVARCVVQEAQTPAAVVVAIARAQRVRAASMRERAEAHRERGGQLGARMRSQEARKRSGGPDESPNNA